MRNRRVSLGPVVATIFALLTVAGRSEANLVTYSDSSSFQAGATGTLNTQTFNLTNTAPSEAVNATGPLDSSNNANVLPGLTIDAAQSPPNNLAVFGPSSSLGYQPLSLAEYTLLPNFGGALNFAFDPVVTAVSLNLVSIPTAGAVDVSVFSPTQSLLGTFTVNVAPNSGAGQFFGVIANGGEKIGSISVLGTVGLVGVEQLQFNTAGVPEPSSLGMLATGCLFGLAWARRRRPGWGQVSRNWKGVRARKGAST